MHKLQVGVLHSLLGVNDFVRIASVVGFFISLLSHLKLKLSGILKSSNILFFTSVINILNLLVFLEYPLR